MANARSVRQLSRLDTQELITAEEAAVLLNCSTADVQKRGLNGEFPIAWQSPNKVGTMLFHLGDIEWIASEESSSTSLDNNDEDAS